MAVMTLATLLFALLAAGLVAAIFYFVGLRAGERLGRDETRTHLDAIARAAADQSNQQAQQLYERATGQAVARLEAAARSDRELGQEQFAKTAAPLRDSLTEVRRLASELEEKRARDHGSLEEVAKRLSTQVDTVIGSSEALRQALKGDRQARGKWGEIQLQSLVERAGLTPHCDFEVQKGRNGARPDLILRLPGGTVLPVDSKFPWDDYLKATEAASPEDQDRFFVAHAKRVKAHADDLARKDYPAKLGEGPPFTVLFLPIEPLLSEAVRHEPDLLQYAADRKVVLATPHTLLGLLWSVAAMWRNETSSRNAEEMRNTGLELERRLQKFLGHFADVGSQLRKANDAYNGAVGSAETRLTPQLRKLRELAGQAEETPEDRLPKSVDVVPRRLIGEDVDLIAERELV